MVVRSLRVKIRVFWNISNQGGVRTHRFDSFQTWAFFFFKLQFLFLDELHLLLYFLFIFLEFLLFFLFFFEFSLDFLV